jgi:hypothetical protein
VTPTVFETQGQFLYAEYRLEVNQGGTIAWYSNPSETAETSVSEGTYVLRVLRDVQRQSGRVTLMDFLSGGRQGDHLTSGAQTTTRQLNSNLGEAKIVYEQRLQQSRTLSLGDRTELFAISGPEELACTEHFAFGHVRGNPKEP